MIRLWGRNYDVYGNPAWVSVATDANGYNDDVYLTALCQVLQLQTGESPFYSTDGIPSHQSIMTQVAPDNAIAAIQQKYAVYFLSLMVYRATATGIHGEQVPVYNISAICRNGATLTRTIAQ